MFIYYNNVRLVKIINSNNFKFKFNYYYDEKEKKYGKDVSNSGIK